MIYKTLDCKIESFSILENKIKIKLTTLLCIIYNVLRGEKNEKS